MLEAGIALFARQGLEGTTIQQIAAEAGVSVGLVCRYFATKEHIVLALYGRLADALEQWAAEMPAGTVAQRFHATMLRKFGLLEEHRRTLIALAARALDPEARSSVLGPAAEVVRSQVTGVFQLAVVGATDAPAESAANLARLLYGMHLLLVLLYIQDGDPKSRSAREALDLAAMAVAGRDLALVANNPIMERVHGLLARLFGEARPGAPAQRARVVLERIFRRRRVLPGVALAPSEAALALHLPRIEAFIATNKPIQLVLPAFPAKSPNPAKVLGKLPDTAEWLALESLESLLDEIGQAHAPGAELVICSHGHVFADLVGVSDDDVTAYRRALEKMLAELDTGRIRMFGLEDAFGSIRPAEARRLLCETYAPAIADVRARAERSPSHRAQLEGVHRFLFEDEIASRPKLTRSQARKHTRERAYEVVRRSEAWGALVAAAFPRAVRLSIHPQPEVSSKIGIALLPTDDVWLTPWHGVALLDGERARLVRRTTAEQAGAQLVIEDGCPSYMEVRA
ncbi:MAG: hypothetical protein JWO36_2406 [Myxococcales bacterium]|nr:hypothetical protein [Myxococcales bacterium]